MSASLSTACTLNELLVLSKPIMITHLFYLTQQLQRIWSGIHDDMLEDEISTQTSNKSHDQLMHEIVKEYTFPQTRSKQNVSIVSTLSPEEEYRSAQVLFYKSYDPTLGYNTAAVLGGLLVFILMYVFYRTKIRKPLIRLIKTKIKQLRHNHSPTNEVDENGSMLEQGNQQTDKEFQTTTKDSRDMEHYESLKSMSSDRKDSNQMQNTTEDCKILPQVTIVDDNRDPLPIVFMDTDNSTAEWVHKQHQLLSPGGIIVKVKSDTICPQKNDLLTSSDAKPSKMCCLNPQCMFNKQIISGAHSQNALNSNKNSPMCDSYEIPYDRHVNESNRPKRSLLLTAKHQSLSFEPRTPVTNAIPTLLAAKYPSVSSEPKSPVSKISPGNFPMHITPIIKIQNTDKQIHNSLKTDGNRDSASSSSSEDHQVYRISSQQWQRSRSPPRRSMTEESHLPSCNVYNSSPFSRLKYKQLSVEDACHLGLLIPATKVGHHSPSCQSVSQMETPL